ncbi:hypothetical protein SCP_0308650 [Sparassis crispa]|uniref:Mmc1 C-terminal domain-containing protein n=1 Tax=Sparassis crispa TaxID=139825 RepID=A0A401GG46_9APHY|nr:hypothetical protein SCP_0308650 [Sparassis crispa]GBE81139.1 hypothetical protein SCP_0308650 [Sparassis crispa]
MPTCLVYSLRPSFLPSVSYRYRDVLSFPKTVAVHLSRGRITPWAALSTATPAAVKPDDGSVAYQHTLTVLHKTRSLLPRIFPSGQQSVPGIESLEFWHELLASAYNDLSPTRANVIRIAVYGCDDFSGAQELVTALLEEPFASESQKESVRTRWKSMPDDRGSMIIQDAPSPASGSLSIHSSWLQRFGVPIQVLELRPPTHDPWSFGDLSTSKALLAADVPIVVCNPTSTPLPSLLSSPSSSPLNHPNAILVVTSPIPSVALSRHVQSLRSYGAPTLFIDAARALTALRVISVEPSSPVAVQKYQNEFEGSNLSSLTETIASVIASKSAASNVVAAIHAQTARALIQDSLSACHSTLERAVRGVDEISERVSTLEDRVEEARARVGLEVFGAPGGKNGEEDEIQRAVNVAKRDVERVMNDLTWWRLLWRVDDVREIVGGAIDRAWCKDLEMKLTFHAGRLAALQQSLTTSSMALLASLPSPSPFCSPVLQNTLSQLVSAPAYPLDAAAFTAPLHSRRHQLRFPTARLHSAAQQTVLGMVGSTFAGLGVAWAGWAGQLGLFDMGMQMETAIAVGMLGAVAGVRWAAGRFEKAKKRWWQDWDRVGEGLARDLKTTLSRTMDDRVLIVSKTACSGLEQLAAERRDKIDELKYEVTVLEEELQRSN